MFRASCLRHPISKSENQLANFWGVNHKSVQAAFAQASSLGFADPSIAFLLAKGINSQWVSAPDGTPQTDFHLLLNSPDPRWTACRARLDGLLQPNGDKTFAAAPHGWQTFAGAMKTLPKWSQPGAFVFHRDKKVSLVQRCQLSGLCYIHAPEVVQHYLVAMNDPKVGMIDMARMIRQTFPPVQLRRHIFDDAGGASRDMLEHILAPGSVIFASCSTFYANDLKQYGPGLVTGFKVHPDFYATDAKKVKHSHSGTPTGSVVGCHAMALIGARTDKKQQWFLLQNWWKRKQFVEVSETYLKACNALVYFVKTPQMKIPTKFPKQPRLFAENDNLDKPDHLPHESPLMPPSDEP
jgi:hypothetical protein